MNIDLTKEELENLKGILGVLIPKSQLAITGQEWAVVLNTCAGVVQKIETALNSEEPKP
jgi:hypothetical protein